MKVVDIIHPFSDVQSVSIGKNTKIGAYTVVKSESKIGESCQIMSHCMIEGGVVLKDRVKLMEGVKLYSGVIVEDDCLVGPNSCVTTASLPLDSIKNRNIKTTILKKGASLGANVTVLPGVTVGAGSIVGAGSVVTIDVAPSSVVIGNPARIVRYVNAPNIASEIRSKSETIISVGGACWVEFKTVKDTRGQLTVAQWDQHLPFRPERVFFLHQVPTSKVRGGHAHIHCIQVLVPLSGSVRVVLDNGYQREELFLDRSDKGLLIPAGIWATQYGYTRDCVLAVFASHVYDENDYIRDYDRYLEYCRR
ncbi:WxcM-like domain-containing protein [Pirellulaceae bacterium SH449]